MDLRYLKKQFPDVCKQVFDFDCVFSRREIEDKVLQFSEIFGQKASSAVPFNLNSNTYTYLGVRTMASALPFALCTSACVNCPISLKIKYTTT